MKGPVVQQRTATVVAWIVTAVTIVAVASLWARGRSIDVQYGLFIFHNAPTALTLSWLGRLVVRRRADNSIGPVLLAVAALGAAHVAVAAVADAAIVAWGYDAPITMNHPLIPAEMPLTASVPFWIMNWLWLPQVVLLLTVLPVIFPDGHLPGPKWRVVLWLAGVGGCIFLAGLIADAWPTGSHGVGYTPPAVAALLAAGLLVLLVATAGSVAGLAVHWRRADPADRRPFQVVGSAVAATAVLWIATYPWQWLWVPMILIVLQVMLLAYALAAARFRVHDLEPMLARATVATVLSIAMTACFAGATIAAGLLAARLTDNDVLPLVAVGIVAIGVEPIRRAGRRLIDRIVFRLAADRTQVVSEVAARAGSGAGDDMLGAVVDALRRGTGALRVEAWLTGEHGSEPAAVTGRAKPSYPTTLSEPIVSHGEHLGELRLLVDVPGDLAPGARDLLADVAHVTGAALHNGRLSAALEAQLGELRSSRRRLVEAQDSARRSVERDLHDGAQAQLIALKLRLAVVQSRLAEPDDPAPSEPGELAGDLADISLGIDGAVDTLRDLARGLQPPILDQGGIAAALRADARKLPVPVTVLADGIGRHEAAVESAVYFACLEAIQNALKHSGASRIEVRLARRENTLTFTVTDDGAGFDPDRLDGHMPRSGLVNITDRLAAVGGTLAIESRPGARTRVSGSVDLAAS